MKRISSKTHTIIGLVVGVALILAPHLFAFSDNQVSSIVAVCVGIFIIVSELITTSRMSPLKLVPMKIHLILDYVTGAFLALSPWHFGFIDARENVWVPHLLVGIVIVGYALLTDPSVDEEKPVTT